jgi:arginine N-succinyltransferase
MIHAQHGDFDEPHVFFRVMQEERYADLRVTEDAEVHDVHMTHTMLYLGQTYDGPTELGGLVLHPDLRRHPDKLGRLLSLARFVFIAAFRGWFRDRLLAELLPPLYKGPGGTRSPLWDALGHKFTGLSYDEADRLSRSTRSSSGACSRRCRCTRACCPTRSRRSSARSGRTLSARSACSRASAFSTAAASTLSTAGPHYEADTDQVTFVRDTRSYQPIVGEPDDTAQPGIVAVTADRSPHFRAVWTPVQAVHDPDDSGQPTLVRVGEAALTRLGVTADEARVLVALRPQRRHSDRTSRVFPPARAPTGSLRTSS